MNKRLQKMITNNLIPNNGGVFIDAYNQTINTEIAGTITTRVDASNMVYVTEIILLNTDKYGNCSCIKADYHKMGVANFLKHQNDGFKATCIMEIKTTETATTICLNSKVDGKQPSLQDRVYDCCGGGHREPKVLTPRRTDFGKSIRKQYESHQVNMSRHDMTQLEPREDGISNTITTVQKDNLLAEPKIIAMRGRNPDNPSERGKSNGKYRQRMEENKDGVSNTLTSVQKDNLVAEPLLIPEATTKGYAEAYDGDSVNLALPNSKTRRGRVGHQQANTIDTSCNQGVVTNYRIRKLTPRECFRLMDVSESDIDKLLNAGLSNARLYKLAGNSIVCSVIYHVLRKMFIETQNENQQLTLF